MTAVALAIPRLEELTLTRITRSMHPDDYPTATTSSYELFPAILDVNANAKVMQGVVLQAKKLGKSIYVLSVDASAGKVAHVNAVSEEAKAKGLDGREWAAAVVEVVGGKVSAFGSGHDFPG